MKTTEDQLEEYLEEYLERLRRDRPGDYITYQYRLACNNSARNGRNVQGNYASIGGKSVD